MLEVTARRDTQRDNGSCKGAGLPGREVVRSPGWQGRGGLGGGMAQKEIISFMRLW